MAAKDVEKAEEQGLTEFFKLTSKINTSNMICFDFDGKIKKYTSPEEIIEEFYPKRLAYYQKRKASTAYFEHISQRSNGGFDIGLPRERTAIAIREVVQSSALCEDDRQQGVGGVQPQKGRDRRRAAPEEVPAFPQGGKGKGGGRDRGRRGERRSRGGGIWHVDGLRLPFGHGDMESHEREGAHALISV